MVTSPNATVVSFSQLANVFCGIVVILASDTADLSAPRFEHPSNTASPNVVTLLAVNVFNPTQSLNALFLIVVIPSRFTSETMLEHPRNMFVPMVSMLAPKVMVHDFCVLDQGVSSYSEPDVSL